MFPVFDLSWILIRRLLHERVVSNPLTSALVCLPTLSHAQVKPVADDEMFKVLRSGKRKNKAWKRMVTKVRQRGDFTLMTSLSIFSPNSSGCVSD